MEVPTIRLDHLSEAQRRAFMIADNRLTEIASWDDRLLAEQLKELASLDLDFDIEATGFDIGEIDLRIESLAAGPNEPKEAPIPAASGPAASQAGDLWLLGPHRVFCGSALEAASYPGLWVDLCRRQYQHGAWLQRQCAGRLAARPEYEGAYSSADEKERRRLMEEILSNDELRRYQALETTIDEMRRYL
jgi:hypothetical protein